MKRLGLLVLIAGCHVSLIGTVNLSPSILPKRLLAPAADSLPKCVAETTFIKRTS